jgi:RNA polymerase sigma-70 factor, ECF subfamily
MPHPVRVERLTIVMCETELHNLVRLAQAGDVAAFGRVVRLTQRMVHGLCLRILRCPQSAADASQEAYLRAFAQLKELRDPDAFPGWLRRIALTTAIGLRRGGHLRLTDAEALADVPVLDEEESTWTQGQRDALARALVRLPDEDRVLCDRFYHGGWSVARLAADAMVTDVAMRKRMQRIRDRLREEIDMNQIASTTNLPEQLPEKIVELLSRPKLTALPENPVGSVWNLFRELTSDYQLVEVPEVVNDKELADAFGVSVAHVAQEVSPEANGVHRLNESSFLRTDMTMPLLLSLKRHGGPMKITASGKTYRAGKPGAMRLETFHQAELLLVQENYSPWQYMDTLMSIVTKFCPGRRVQVEQHAFLLCDPAWKIAVDVDGQWRSVLGWGTYTEPVLHWLGCDPRRYTAVGAGFGLERLASLYYGIDDLRRIETMRI